MSCACPSNAVSDRDPMVAAFEHFWPKGMPFPPAFPWLGVMFTRQNLFAGAVGGGQATPTPVEDGVVVEEEDWGLPQVTPAQETVVKEGADIFGNVLVFPAPEISGVRRGLVGKPSIVITRGEFDRIAGGSRALEESLLAERLRLMAPELNVREVMKLARELAQDLYGVRERWSWIIVIRSNERYGIKFYVTPYSEGSDPPAGTDPWLPPDSEDDSGPTSSWEDGTGGTDVGSSGATGGELNFDEEAGSSEDSYESPFKTDWGKQGENQEDLEDDDEGGDSLIVDPCRRYPQICHGIRLLLSNYVEWYGTEYRWHPVM